jgi:hypothetical protein
MRTIKPLRIPALAICCLLGVSALAEEYSWNTPHAKVMPTGDLQWRPEPFAFRPGATTRYIDYENGDDANPGTRAKPWKHHPWDANAAGRAAEADGPITYVFKRGVIYRGQLIADESGRDDEPIRLTSDPDWGEGKARLWGSIRLPRKGWKKASAQDMPRYMPDEGRIWMLETSGIKLSDGLVDNFARPAGADLWVYSLFEVEDDDIRRVHIARDPDWREGNPNFPLSYWHKWDGFFKGEGAKKVGRGGQDDDLKGKPEDFFEGGYLASQWKGNMGTPCWNRIGKGKYSPEHGTIGAIPWFVAKGTRYMIENVPAYLDSPGEFYFAREGRFKGRLYVRLHEDADPRKTTLEAPAIQDIIAIRDQRHIEISGLSFGLNRVASVGDQFLMQISNPTCVRIGGDCRDIRVSNNEFHHVIMAVSAFPRPSQRLTNLHSQGLLPWKADDLLDEIHITDNDIAFCEREAICVVSGAGRDPGAGRLGHAEVLRNRLHEIGFRQGHWRYSAIPAIRVWYPRTAEIAGNMIDRTWGSGLMVHGGKHGADKHAPLTRILVHHNKVENTVLAVNDYGAISLWQGGPIYCYNNISGNAVGHAPDRDLKSPWKNVGYPYYIDGGYKIYTFNNISWGRSNEASDPYRNNGTYFMVFGFLNPVVNNTFYKAYKGIAGSSGNRSDILGNIVADIKTSFIASNRMGDPSLAGGGDTGEMGLRGVPSLAYANNLFGGDAEAGTLYRPNRRALRGGAVDKLISAQSVEQLSEQMRSFPIRYGQLGWHSQDIPLVDPDSRDFRPKAGSKAIDKGVKYFIPWALYATVGEWHFNQNQADPARVIDYHYYMTEEYIQRKMYEYIPTFDLAFAGATADAYVASASENWAPGAMRLDGKRTGVVARKTIESDFAVDLKAWVAKPQVSKKHIPGKPWRITDEQAIFPGRLRKTLDIKDTNVLVEAIVRVDPGRNGGTIAAKHDGKSGYRLGLDGRGRPMMLISADGRSATVAGPEAINDDEWHHVLGEFDRKAGWGRIYVDGKQVARSSHDLPAKASLSNGADFVVGRDLTGAIDFLRVCQGTLDDARTDIEELYAWQMRGPVTRDFCGHEPKGRRDIGAIERVD